MNQTPHFILGLRPEANLEEALSAYKRLTAAIRSKLRSNDKQAWSKLRKLNDAYAEFRRDYAEHQLANTPLHDMTDDGEKKEEAATEIAPTTLLSFENEKHVVNAELDLANYETEVTLLAATGTDGGVMQVRMERADQRSESAMAATAGQGRSRRHHETPKQFGHWSNFPGFSPQETDLQNADENAANPSPQIDGLQPTGSGESDPSNLRLLNGWKQEEGSQNIAEPEDNNSDDLMDSSSLDIGDPLTDIEDFPSFLKMEDDASYPAIGLPAEAQKKFQLPASLRRAMGLKSEREQTCFDTDPGQVQLRSSSEIKPESSASEEINSQTGICSEREINGSDIQQQKAEHIDEEKKEAIKTVKSGILQEKTRKFKTIEQQLDSQNLVVALQDDWIHKYQATSFPISLSCMILQKKRAYLYSMFAQGWLIADLHLQFSARYDDGKLHDVVLDSDRDLARGSEAKTPPLSLSWRGPVGALAAI